MEGISGALRDDGAPRARIAAMVEALRAGLVGRRDLVERLMIGLLTGGHVLLEGPPGLAKTRAVKLVAGGLHVSFSRIQCTPDLMPADLTGTLVLKPDQGAFEFVEGPIFHSLVLVDEINRAPPKVQSALLEAMAEKQCTVDNRTRKLDDLFLVIATQNPLDVAGTFPLPNAQLDRFLFKIRMTHINPQAELEILRDYKMMQANLDRDDLPRVTRTEIIQARRVIRDQMYVHPAFHQCLVDIAQVTRNHDRILQGVSTRSLVLALPALQARALTKQRNYVTADDIDALAGKIFAHRLEPAPGAGDTEALVRDCCSGALERIAGASMSR
jgi:MoxR-like ATPase